MLKKIFSSEYRLMTIALFLAFFAHGMGGMIISQNDLSLQGQWGTGEIATVLSALGFGRLSVFFIAGKLSDIIGRRFFVILGAIVYIAALIGMAFSPNLASAVLFGVMFGMANSFLDVGTYPALMEAFPDDSKKINTALVISIRIAQLLLPLLMVGVFSATGLNVPFRVSFFMVAIILAATLVIAFIAPFPDHKESVAKQKELKKASKVEGKKGSSILSPEGIAFIVYGFISMATFMIIQQFSNRFGRNVLEMDEDLANLIPTFFAAGSILGVITSIAALKKFKAVNIMLVLTSITLVATSMLSIEAFLSVPTLIIGTALIGFAAAGGVMQMALTLMSETIALGKGLVSGIFLSMGSVASIVIPLAVAEIRDINERYVMFLNAGIAAIGVLCAIVIAICYKRKEKTVTKGVIND